MTSLIHRITRLPDEASVLDHATWRLWRAWAVWVRPALFVGALMILGGVLAAVLGVIFHHYVVADLLPSGRHTTILGNTYTFRSDAIWLISWLDWSSYHPQEPHTAITIGSVQAWAIAIRLMVSALAVLPAILVLRRHHAPVRIGLAGAALLLLVHDIPAGLLAPLAEPRVPLLVNLAVMLAVASPLVFAAVLGIVARRRFISPSATGALRPRK